MAEKKLESKVTQDELIAKGINRFRRPIWADPNDYARVDVINGMRGPWLHLWARRTQEAIGERTPQDVLNLAQDPTSDYEPYTGALDPEDTKP